MIDSSYGYELRLLQKYGLCWFQTMGFKFWWSDGYGLQAEVQLLPVQRVKVQLSQVPGAHRMMSTCVKNGETEPVVVVVWLQVLKRSATTYMCIYMFLIW